MPNVLDVGNCGFDHSSLEAILRPFEAQLTAAHSADDALEHLRGGRFDLVLINRVFDRGGGSGLELLKSIKADQQLADVPVILITNFAQVQQEAQAAGAEPGFGKSDLHSESTHQALSRFFI